MPAWGAGRGVRHAMPLVIVLAVLSGALAWRASTASRRAWRLLPVGLLVLAAGMTWREPRLWEYHNEIVGGTAGAHRYFSNESVELGQRLHEIEAFHAREIGAGAEPLYIDYWAYMTEGYAASRSLRMRRRVESVHDENPEGVFAGWFLKEANARLPAPQYDYDPAEALQGLVAVERIGNVELWRGRQVRPQSRDWPMFFHVLEYVYAEGGNDWSLVATRLQDIVARRPQMFAAALELGNTYLKLGQREQARKAYADALAQDLLPVPAALRAEMQARIEALDAGTALARIEPIRNPMLE
jgi:tetratricopeptide (TPR) repeat protein